MKDWNVVATAQEKRFSDARKLLEQFGLVEKTSFYNILTMNTADPAGLLPSLEELARHDPGTLAPLTRVLPVVTTFTFQSPPEFEVKSREAVHEWVSLLAGKSFHLRMHRRGFKGKLSSMDEERFLDEYLLKELDRAGTPGQIAFDDPDAIIALETLGTQAGLSLWTREVLQRYPLLHLD